MIEIIEPQKGSRPKKIYGRPVIRINKGVYTLRGAKTNRATVYFYREAVTYLNLEKHDRIRLLKFPADSCIGFQIVPDSDVITRGFSVNEHSSGIMLININSLYDRQEFKEGFYEVEKEKHCAELDIYYYPLTFIHP